MRIFNTFGERMRKDDGRAVPNFITQALKNKPLSVYGKGTQTRSFCYINDLVEGLYKLLLSGANDPINIGNPKEITLIKLARKVIALTQSRGKISFKPLPQDDPKVRCPDISRARKILGWEPKTSVEEGLSRTIDWFRRQVR